MNKKTKAILRENNELEKRLSKEADRVLTDIVVYLRQADVNEYNQELARRDITNMLIEGEARGENAAAVIGGDYKAFCDAVIAELPKKTKKEQLSDAAQIVLLCIGLLLGIHSVFGMIAALAASKSMTLAITWGDALTVLLISVFAVTTVNLICRNAFDKVEKTWLPPLLLGVAAAVSVMPGFLIKAAIFHANAFVLLASAVLILGIYKLLDVM